MKGKDIIKIIQENHLEEFELKVNNVEIEENFSNSDEVWNYNLKQYFIDELVDIGYSDKTVTFGIV